MGTSIHAATVKMATNIIQQIFDEPSLLTDAMMRQIKLSFDHFRKICTVKSLSRSLPFGNVSGDNSAFSKLFNPYMPLKNFMASFKTLAARNQTSFFNASRDLLNKYATTLKSEAAQNAVWESQDPRTVQWTKYTEHDMVRIESVYQNFVDKFIEGKLQNFEKIEATINVHIDAQAFIVNVRENRQKNSSGGSRKIRRRRLNLE